MNRNKWLALLSFTLALTVVLSACTPAATPTAAPKPTTAQAQPAEAPTKAPEPTAAPEPTSTPEPVELRISWWGSQDRHDRTIKVIELFQQKYPHIKVTYEFAGWGDYWTKLNTQAAGGSLPDVIQQDYMKIAEWSGKDLIIPLDSLVADGTLDFTNVAQASLQGGMIDGKLYAVNLGNNSQAWVLDLDAFEKAGLDLPPAQWTWDDFEAITLALHDKLGIWGHNGSIVSSQQWKSLYLGLGQWAFSDDGTELGYTDDQPFIDLLHLTLRLQQAGAIPNPQESESFTLETDPVVTGDSAMTYLWSNQLVALWTAAGEARNLKLWQLPRPAGGQSSNYIKPSMFWSVSAHSKHPKEAAMFIDFFTNSLEANEIMMAERGVPISSVVRDGLKPKLTKMQQETFDFLDRVEKDCSPIRPPDPPGATDVVTNILDPQVLQPVRYGLLTPEEGAALLRKEANAILAKNK
jgi:multiple sugar transport system substrate-binding protein